MNENISSIKKRKQEMFMVHMALTEIFKTNVIVQMQRSLNETILKEEIGKHL